MKNNSAGPTLTIGILDQIPPVGFFDVDLLIVDLTRFHRVMHKFGMGDTMLDATLQPKTLTVKDRVKRFVDQAAVLQCGVVNVEQKFDPDVQRNIGHDEIWC